MQNRLLKNILVTGGAGFIGSNFIRYIFNETEFNGRIINYDLLTYAGNIANLTDISAKYTGTHYFFEYGDICDQDKLEKLFEKYNIDTVIHFAAESHVDRSISGPSAFIRTNICGTFTLLEVINKFWARRTDVLFHQVSTDEVFGSLGDTGYFYETTPYAPRSPYSASKASADHLVKAYHHTYSLPITISNCSNNYGPYQYTEKLIPVIITRLRHEKYIPVYGDGKNVRDWLHVDDHNSAIWTIINKGLTGENYNIGGENEWTNLKLVYKLCSIMNEQMGKPFGYYEKFIKYVEDRAGHDRRYAINCDKIKNELGWRQQMSFDKGLEQTVAWYLKQEGEIK